jgi:hypothetical protein
VIYQPALPKFDHQVRAAEALAKRPLKNGSDAFAYLCDMGTGKTKMVLDEWGEAVASGRLDNLLVIAPAGSYRNWFEDRSEDLPSELRKHLAPDLHRQLEIAFWRSGQGNVAWRSLTSFLAAAAGPRALIVNVEALSKRGRKGDARPDAFEVCKTFLSSGRTMMVVDESTRIKSIDAIRTKNILKLGPLAKARRIMSGLPTPQSPLDIFAQFAFLDEAIIGYESFWAFKMRYAITKRMRINNVNRDIVVGYRKTEEIARCIAPFSFRCLKEECLDIPPKTWTIEDYELPPEQRRVYSELKENATVHLGNQAWVTPSIVLSQFLRLHQIAAGFVVDDDKATHVFSKPRVSVVLELLEEVSGKAIVWAPYELIIDNLVEAIRKEHGPGSVAKYSGGNADARGGEELRFLTKDECRFMVSNPASGGVGNNWTVAGTVIYYSNSFNLEHRAQSEDRAHRAGQDKKVLYVDVVARDTIDAKVLKALRAKIDMSTAITGDRWKEWVV